MPRKIGNAPTKVIVLPGGINKPSESKNDKEIVKENKCEGGIKEPATEKPTLKPDCDPLLNDRASSGRTHSPSQTPRRSAWETDCKPKEPSAGSHLPGSVDVADSFKLDNISPDTNASFKILQVFRPMSPTLSPKIPFKDKDLNHMPAKAQKERSDSLQIQVPFFVFFAVLGAKLLSTVFMIVL